MRFVIISTTGFAHGFGRIFKKKIEAVLLESAWTSVVERKNERGH